MGDINREDSLKRCRVQCGECNWTRLLTTAISVDRSRGEIDYNHIGTSTTKGRGRGYYSSTFQDAGTRCYTSILLPFFSLSLYISPRISRSCVYPYAKAGKSDPKTYE